MRRIVAGISCILCVLAVPLLSACTHSEDEPTITAPSNRTASVAPTPGLGADRIGGAVTANLATAPRVVLPKTKAPQRLLTKDIVKGNGAAAGPESNVTVRYVGMSFTTGGMFHSTWTAGGTESFSLVGYIVGFADGVAGMRVGGRREIVVPPSLAYGARGNGEVKPNETLVFVVDLLGVG